MGEDRVEGSQRHLYSSRVGVRGQDMDWHLDRHSLHRRDDWERGSQADVNPGYVRSGGGHSSVERGAGQVKIREADDRGSVDYLRDSRGSKQSQFNVGLAMGDSAAVKFQWETLLAESSNSKAHAAVDANAAGNRVDKDFQGPRRKEFESSWFLDCGGPGSRLARNAPLSMGSERDRTLSRYRCSVGNRDTCDHVSDGSPSLTKYMDVRFEEGEAPRRQGISQSSERNWRSSHRDLENPRFYSSGDGSHGPTPLAQSNELQTPTQGFSRGFLQPSYRIACHERDPVGYGQSRETVSKPSGFAEFSPRAHYRAVEAPKCDVIDYPCVKYTPTKPCGYPSEGSKGAYTDSLSHNVHDKLENARKHCSHQASLRDASEATIRTLGASEISHGCPRRESRLRNQDDALEEQPISNHMEFTASDARNYAEEALGSRSTKTEYETEGIEAFYLTEECDSEKDAADPYWDWEERQGRLPETELDPAFYMMDDNSQMGLVAGDMTMNKRKRRVGKRMRWSHSTDSPYEVYASDTNHDLSCNRKPITSKAAGFRSHGMKHQPVESHGFSKSSTRLRPSKLSISLQNRLGERCSHGGSDIKKQLVPASPLVLSDIITHEYETMLASQAFPLPETRLHKTKKTNTRKQSKPCPWVIPYRHAHQEEDVLRHHSFSHRKQKNPVKNLEECQLRFHAEEDDTSKLMVKPVKDPPENTEEFKWRVQDSFLKYIRFLNEHPGRLRKFKEQGKAGSLKCMICSSSKEFVDAKAIATHAFTSPKLGLRCKHLGFHKALCVLMGWDSSLSPNGRWICKTLADADAIAVVEDFIIWPPVVIIHHSSAGDYHRREMTLSLDLLETILRGMGFDEGRKVCRGKPGNPNIMVVKFLGTKSGLEEAERLHSVFAQKKHGRAELQKIDRRKCYDEGKPPEALLLLEEEMKENLFGFIGIAEDLDKLNYDVKALCVVRSKKEMQAKIRAIDEAAL
ncbi:hypothetical protein Dimus_009416 [Dionaea muscipula]